MNDDPHGLANPKDGDVRLGDHEWDERIKVMRDRLAVRHPSYRNAVT